MPPSLHFVVFSNPEDMRSQETKAEVRKFVMKDIGKARRRLRPRPIQLALRKRSAVLNETPSTAVCHLDQALYEPHVRAMSCRMDPFCSAIIPIDDTASGLLKYFVYYSTKFPQNFTFTADITEVLKAALQDELMINCILGAAASRMQYMPGATPLCCSGRALSCTYQCLHLLRRRLEHHLPTSARSVEPIIDCILYLVAAAIYRGEDDCARVHIQAARKLCQMIGGVRCLRDKCVLIRLLSLDDLLASIALQPCTFDCSYDSGPFTSLGTDIVQSVVTARACTASGLLTERDDLLPDTIKLLVAEILECDRYRHGVMVTGGILSPHALAVRHWWTLRSLSIRNRLLRFVAVDHKTNTLKLALIIWTLLPPSDARQTKTAQKLSWRLRRALADGATYWQGDEDVKIWCLLVGFFASICIPSCRQWFSSEIRGGMRSAGRVLQPGKKSELVENLVSFQQRFLFRRPVLQGLTEKLAEDLLSEGEQTKS